MLLSYFLSHHFSVVMLLNCNICRCLYSLLGHHPRPILAGRFYMYLYIFTWIHETLPWLWKSEWKAHSEKCHSPLPSFPGFPSILFTFLDPFHPLPHPHLRHPFTLVSALSFSLFLNKWADTHIFSYIPMFLIQKVAHYLLHLAFFLFNSILWKHVEINTYF